MILLDCNILLYAYDKSAPEHRRAKQWLESAFNGGEAVALPWVTVWAFVRIATNARILRHPFRAAEVFAIVNSWLEQDNVALVNPGPRHAELLRRLVLGHQARGPQVTDAVLAALALENGATVVSTDHDFSRFPVKWIDPLASASS